MSSSLSWPGDAEPRLVAHRHRGHVGHQHRRAVGRGQHGAADVFHRADLADRAHDRRLRPDIHRVGADIDVGVVQPVQHLLQREAVGKQPVEVDGDVVGLGLAAPAGDVDHARHRLEAALQDPVLDGLEVEHRVARRPDHAIAEDLADRAGRRQHGLHAVRQRCQLAQPVDDVLRGLLVGHVVGELHLHVRQAEQRDGADRLDVRDAGHLHFDRDGDVALDLLRRLAGILGDDVDQRRHRVGIGLDVQLPVGEQAADHQGQCQDDHQDALLQRGGDDGMHGRNAGSTIRVSRAMAARSMNRVPLATTVSPTVEALAHLDQAVGRDADLDRPRDDGLLGPAGPPRRGPARLHRPPPPAAPPASAGCRRRRCGRRRTSRATARGRDSRSRRAPAGGVSLGSSAGAT